MKITCLGQAGFLFEYKNTKIMIDPYLSNSVASHQPQNERRFPVDESFFNIKPDVMVITHNHGDHYDKETFNRFITSESKAVILCPSSVWNDARGRGGENNFILFNVGTSITVNEIVFMAVKAVHSDDYAIGVVIKADGEKYYITGDTLYNESIFKRSRAHV